MNAEEQVREALLAAEGLAVTAPMSVGDPRSRGCPSIPRLLDVAEGIARFSEQERSHVRSCRLCQAALRGAFSEGCPDPAVFGPGSAGEFADSPALREHLDECPRCRARSYRRGRLDRSMRPSPTHYTRIGLAATTTLRGGATSPFARLIRELTPYFMEYQPHLYALEGSFRTILTCGLLRDYPPERLHCVPGGRLGGLVDLGAAVVGEPVIGLDEALGDAADVVTAQLDLNSPDATPPRPGETASRRSSRRPLELDCVIYLLDPLAPTSGMSETLALKRQCVVAEKPFLDTYASAAEWFGLLGYTASGERLLEHFVADEVLDRLPEAKSRRNMLAIVAHDSKKWDVVNFAREHLTFLSRFKSRVATGVTAKLLNGEVPERLAATNGLRELVDELHDAAICARVERPWIRAARDGARGGGVQISEMLAMGLCDALVSFEDPQPRHERGLDVQLYERSACISNQAERIGGPSDIVCLHDPRSADVWARLWEEIEDNRSGATPTLITAVFRRLFNVDLVVVDSREDYSEQWAAIVEEAAWYLVSAIAAKRTHANRSHEPKRVAVSCGSAVRAVIGSIHSAGMLLCERIGDYEHRLGAAVEASKAAASDAHAHRIIDLIADRKKLSLRPSADNGILWSIGDVVVAPMVGTFGSTDPTVEADENAAQLARTIGGTSLELATNAFIDQNRPSEIPAELDTHWQNADIILMSCADLDDHWFGASGKVALYEGMYGELKEKAVGEIAGLYLNADGEPVEPIACRRRGMGHKDIRAVARGTDGRAAILVAGAQPPRLGAPPNRARTVLAALRGHIASVLVTDIAFAQALLREHADEARQAANSPSSAREATWPS